MKNMADVEKKLRAELNQWFVRQVRNESEDFYLYYAQTSHGQPGEIRIESNMPLDSGYARVGWIGRINKGFSIDQNMKKLREICRHLPILEY